MKCYAYYKENGSYHLIHSRQVLHNERQQPGQWRRREYFSTHREPTPKLRMHHKFAMEKDSCFFAFNSGQNELIAKYGDGESLTHRLYKIAISELKATTLVLKDSNLRLPIKILSTEIEKPHHYRESAYPFRFDVFCTFDSNSPYKLKWNGELVIEVHVTNEVKGKKLQVIAESDISAVEFTVSKWDVYARREEHSTPELERAFIERIKKRLYQSMDVKMVNNPSTKEYLQQENSKLKKHVKQFQGTMSDLETKKEWLTSNNMLLNKRLINTNFQIANIQDVHRKTLNELNRITHMNPLRFTIYRYLGW